MKKLMFLFVLVFAMIAFVGCAGVNQSYADKVNEAAEAKEYLTYEDVVKDLGEPTIKVAGSIAILDVTGAATWAKGCDTAEELAAKVEAGEAVDTIVITFANGKAMGAKFVEGQAKEAE